MGYSQEAHSLPFGYNAIPAEDIDGLAVSCRCPRIHLSLSTRLHQLLEDHLKSLRTENVEGGAEDEQGWDNWLVESDSGSSSEESDWIDVESDGSNDLQISDSDNEIANGDPDQHKQPPARVSSLATAKVRNVPISMWTHGLRLLDTNARGFCST